MEIATPGGLLPLPSSLNNSNVAIDRQIREALDAPSGLRPLHFQPIDLRAFPDSQYHAGIMRRQETPSANFHAVALQIARLIRDSRPDGIGIGLASDQAHAEPMIVPASIVAQQNGCGIII